MIFLINVIAINLTSFKKDAIVECWIWTKLHKTTNWQLLFYSTSVSVFIRWYFHFDNCYFKLHFWLNFLVHSLIRIFIFGYQFLCFFSRLQLSPMATFYFMILHHGLLHFVSSWTRAMGNDDFCQMNRYNERIIS